MDSSATMVISEAEIAARLEKATRSGLASSSLASYSYSQASTGAQLSQPSTLADLLPRLGPTDGPRCPACGVSLPFGPRSRICLACTAPLLQSPPPSFTSTLAFRCFSEALQIHGLETNFGEDEEDLCSEPEVDIATKSSSSSFSFEAGRQKVLLHADISPEKGKYDVEPETVKSDIQTPLPSSGDLSSIMAAKSMGIASVHGEKHASILGYSAKLEGISLEDFFSKEVKSQAPALAADSDFTSDKFLGSITFEDASGINVRKDSLFWDPVSESIVPDGFDLMANTSETSTNKGVALDNVVTVAEEDDDPFSSWEGDFQSAVPTMADVLTASSSHAPGPQVSAQPITSRNIEDLFGDSSNMSSVAESVGTQQNNSWINGGDLLGLHTGFESTFSTDSQRSTDADDFFGSGWQQSNAHPVVSSTTPVEGESFSIFNQQSTLPKPSQEEDLFGIFSSEQMEMPIVNNSLDSFGLSKLTEDSLMEQPALAPASAGKKKKIVGSLLGQLHDLSFLLADKLVTRMEGGARFL